MIVILSIALVGITLIGVGLWTYFRKPEKIYTDARLVRVSIGVCA